MATALQLDFQRPSSSSGRWLGWCGLTLAAVGLAAVADGHADAVQRHAVMAERHQHLTERMRTDSPTRRAVVPDEALSGELQRANAVIDQLSVPWEALFDAVEAADARGLAVLSMTPNARDRSLRLTGEIRSIDPLFEYVDRLAAQPVLGQVHLQGYSTVVRDGASVVAFTVAGAWLQRP